MGSAKMEKIICAGTLAMAVSLFCFFGITSGSTAVWAAPTTEEAQQNSTGEQPAQPQEAADQSTDQSSSEQPSASASPDQAATQPPDNNRDTSQTTTER